MSRALNPYGAQPGTLREALDNTFADVNEVIATSVSKIGNEIHVSARVADYFEGDMQLADYALIFSEEEAQDYEAVAQALRARVEEVI